MSRVSSRLSFVGHRSLVVIQTFLLIATLFAPISVAADDPTGDPGASAPPTTEPAATPEPTPDPTAEPTADPTAEPTAEPTTEPPAATPEPTAEPPVATPEPTPEAPVAIPDPTPAPTTEPSTPVGTPTIQSDLADYPPGGLVTLTGSDWQQGESVHIFVNDDWGSSWSRNVDVTADASGAIVDQFNLPNWFVATYRVVATGTLSGSVTTTFTDGNLRFSYSPSGVGNFAGSWTKHTNSNCSGSAAGTAPTSGSGTVTNNPGGTLAAGAGAGEWIKITVPATVGSYSFVNWSGPGSFSSTNATLCAPGFAGNGNDGYVANYTLVTTQSTALSVSPAAGSFGGTVNLSATLTAGASGLSGKTVTFSLNGTSVGPATTNSSGVATLSSASLAGINAGTYASGISASFAGDSGFAASNGSASLTVNKAAGSVTINNIPSSATFGGSFTPTFTKAGDGTASAASGTTATCTISSGVVSYVGAGTCTLQASVTAGTNHLAATGSTQSFTIDQADAVCTVTGYDVEYDAAAHTASGACLGVEGETLAGLDLAGTTHTNAGSFTDGWTFTDTTGNYTDTAGSVADQIDQAGSTVSVDCSAAAETYNGLAHDVCTASWASTGADGEGGSLTVGYDDNVNAGPVIASATFAGDLNHTGNSDTDTFTIDQAGSTVSVDCSAAAETYNGLAHDVCTASWASTGADGEGGSLTVGYDDNVNAGPVIASATFAGDLNHTGNSDTDTFTIDQADAVCTVTGYDVEYDAAAHTASGACLGVEGETLAGLDLAGTTHTNAGSFTDGWTFTDTTGNYTDTAGSVADQIDQAGSTVSVDCSAAAETYNGLAHDVCTASWASTGADGEGGSLTVGYDDNVNAGPVIASATFAGDLNHTGNSDTDTFTIDQAGSTVSVDCSAAAETYNGLAHDVCTASWASTGADGEGGSLTVGYDDNVNAGPVIASATFAGDLNHTGNSDTDTFTIDQKNVTGAFTAADKTWDNSTAASVVTTTVVGALVGDDVELTGGTAAFATSTVGTWTVTLTGAGLTGSDAGNYDLTSVGTTTATITTAFRIIGFDSPVDMTVVGNPRIYNSVKNGQTVPLKFRVFNLNGTEVTSTTGLNAWARNVACASGVVEPDLIPITSTADTGLRRTGDRFHFNWAVPKGALKCYQVLIQTVDGSTTMVGSLSGTPVQEAWFKSK